MNRPVVKLGPIALLLTVITICLAILALLNFSTASADRRLAEKYAETVRVRYELEAEGQALLASFDEMRHEADKAGSLADAEEALSPFERQADGRYTALLEKDGTRLHIEVEADGSDIRVLSWIIDKEWTEDTGLDLWMGF